MKHLGPYGRSDYLPIQKLEGQLQLRQNRICYYREVIMGTHLGAHLEWPGYLRNKLGRVSRVRSALYLYYKLLVGVLPQLVVRINDIDHDIRVHLFNRR